MFNYHHLIVNWLRGANAGKYKSLYIASWGKGTSLFMKGLKVFHSYNENKRDKPVSDTRLAILNHGKVRILTASDPLGIADIARRLGLEVIKNEPRNFKANGIIKNGVVEVR